MKHSKEDKHEEDSLFDGLMEIFFKTYSPAITPREATAFMSTLEIYNSFQTTFPSKKYETETIAEWLHEHGFKLCEMGLLRYEWMIKASDVQEDPK